MLFSVSIGTSGEGDERYVLYIPIVLSPGREFSNIDYDKTISINDYELGFQKLAYFNALTLGQFESEELAHEYVPKIQSALMWVSLEYSIGISFPEKLTEAKLLNGPAPIPKKNMIKDIAEHAGWETYDGCYYSDKLVVLPDHNRLIRWDMGQANVIAGLGVNNFAVAIQEAVSFSSPERVIDDKKLLLAINIYSSYFFEQSSEAKFVKLVTVLEALTPDSIIDDITLGILKELKTTVKSEQSQYQEGSQEWKNINNLLSRVGMLKKNSIGKSLRNFITTAIANDPELGDTKEIVSHLTDVYSRRSKLLHEGVANKELLERDLIFLTNFVPKLLKSMYMREANGNSI